MATLRLEGLKESRLVSKRCKSNKDTCARANYCRTQQDGERQEEDDEEEREMHRGINQSQLATAALIDWIEALLPHRVVNRQSYSPTARPKQAMATPRSRKRVKEMVTTVQQRG